MKKAWTISENEILINEYPDKLCQTIANKLNRSVGSVYNQANVLGLRKSEEFYISEASGRKNLIEAGKKSRFKKGSNPWNAGRTGVRVSPHSEFKKGNQPANTLHDGAITIRTDRDKNGRVFKYKYIRVAKGKWELYHRYVWKLLFGSIPLGNVIIFKDGDSMNCAIDNLECITKAENARRNRSTAKATITRNLMIEEGDFDNGSKSLSDTYVAGIIAEGDIKLREIIKEKHPDLIILKRAQLQLNRKINGYEK